MVMMIPLSRRMITKTERLRRCIKTRNADLLFCGLHCYPPGAYARSDRMVPGFFPHSIRASMTTLNIVFDGSAYESVLSEVDLNVDFSVETLLEIRELLVGSSQALCELVCVDLCDGPTAGTRQLRVLLQPTDRFHELMAAV
jgi:hypothetical protein